MKMSSSYHRYDTINKQIKEQEAKIQVTRDKLAQQEKVLQEMYDERDSL